MDVMDLPMFAKLCDDQDYSYYTYVEKADEIGRRFELDHVPVDILKVFDLYGDGSELVIVTVAVERRYEEALVDSLCNRVLDAALDGWGFGEAFDELVSTMNTCVELSA